MGESFAGETFSPENLNQQNNGQKPYKPQCNSKSTPGLSDENVSGIGVSKTDRGRPPQQICEGPPFSGPTRGLRVVKKEIDGTTVEAGGGGGTLKIGSAVEAKP